MTCVYQAEQTALRNFPVGPNEIVDDFSLNVLSALVSAAPSGCRLIFQT